MIYGMYLSAAGVIANSYRQDVIANNLANSESVGFKRDLAMIQQRPTAAQEGASPNVPVNPLLNNLSGGIFASATAMDTSEGEMEPTGNDLDVALQGPGYLAVSSKGKTQLTRNGEFLVDHAGRLALANNGGSLVLDANQQPIQLNSTLPVSIAADGTLSQGGQPVAKLGVFNVADPATLKNVGGTLLSIPDGENLQAVTTPVRSQYVERSNVEPTTELANLIDVQRQLEANATMIQYQDQTMDKLVNDAGKIS